jgi:hypothetical protein
MKNYYVAPLCPKLRRPVPIFEILLEQEKLLLRNYVEKLSQKFHLVADFTDGESVDRSLFRTIGIPTPHFIIIVDAVKK